MLQRLIELGVDPDVSSTLRYDTMHCRQAQAGSLSHVFGCVNWIKYMFKSLFIHSVSSITYLELNVLSKRNFRVILKVLLVMVDIVCFDLYSSFSKHLCLSALDLDGHISSGVGLAGEA